MNFEVSNQSYLKIDLVDSRCLLTYLLQLIKLYRKKKKKKKLPFIQPKTWTFSFSN